MANEAPLPAPDAPPPHPAAPPAARPAQPAQELTGLSPFKAKQNILFQVVSARIEDWAEKTYCGRLLLRNGAEVEVQASKAALEQWKNIPKYVAYTAEVARSILKPYKAADKTGIEADHFLRTQFRIPNMQRAVAGFPLSVVQARDIADPSNFSQLPEDLIFNVAGIIHHVERPPPDSGPTPARRNVVLATGEWQFTVQFLGDMARARPTPQTAVVIFSVKKRLWQGLLNLETTRLAWCLENPAWYRVPDPNQDGPLRKALRSESLPVVPIADVKRADGQEATCVQASMVPLDDSALNTFALGWAFQ